MKSVCAAVLALSFALVPATAQKFKLPLADPAKATPAEKSKMLDGIFHDYWEQELKHNPEWASELGDKRYNDQVSDYSVKTENERLARMEDLLMQLAAIDPTGVDEVHATSRELLMRKCTQALEGAGFREWELSVNQLDGIYNEYPELVRQLSFNTVEDYDQWIARLHKIPHAFDQVTENLTLGMNEHRTPPAYLVEKALKQVDELGDQDESDSPLAEPLKHFPATISKADQERITDEMLTVIDKEVLPAYIRFSRFLEVSYIPACRKQPGISALPDGKQYYAFLVRRETTTDLTPEQIHQIGLDEVKRDEEQMLAIAQKLGYKDLKSFQAAIKADPKLHPASPEALKAAYEGYINGMEQKLPTLFGRLPKAKLEVVAIPDYRAQNAAQAYYEQGSPDFSRPGRVTVNLWNAKDRSLADVEAISYHEGIPGHHLQISLAQEMTGVPEFRKQDSYTAFVEGWALYSEQLGKDVGFYQDPYSDYGRLEADIWRAIRLVVDTGVHSEGWTRDQMVDYFRQHSGIDETNIQTEVDRYIAWPGQALAYKVGQRKFLELRAKAQNALGAQFDLKAFHDQLLGSGALPLDLVEAHTDAWISAQKKAAARSAAQ
jgi:uncharacterized protein (DUF885 family)